MAESGASSKSRWSAGWAVSKTLSLGGPAVVLVTVLVMGVILILFIAISDDEPGGDLIGDPQAASAPTATSTVSASTQPTPVPTIATTPVSEPSPTPVSFEDSLLGDDLARYRALPEEVRSALDAEASENGLDSALGYLRVLPDTAPPLAELLTEEEMTKFEELDEPRQRQVLIEGYQRSVNLADAVDTAHGYLFGEGLSAPTFPLPPIDQGLSAEAFAKYEALDPLMQFSFRMWWESERHGTGNMDAGIDDPPSAYMVNYEDAAIDNLEKALMAAPAELPDLRDVGLSVEALAVLDKYSQLEEFANQYVAFTLIRRGEIEGNFHERLDSELRLFAADNGVEFLARGLMPGQADWIASDPGQVIPPYPLICAWGSTTGIWPEWALPEYFRGMEPNQLVLFRPDPEVVLSPEALEVLRSLDQPLRERFDARWQAGMSPSHAALIACSVMQTDLNLRYMPVTSMPLIEDIVSQDTTKLFASMPESRQDFIRQFLVIPSILDGKVQIPSQGGQVVYAYGSSREEFLAALGLMLEVEIAKAARSGP